ncbi:DUF4377 domain-containing protein [Reichenbachiella ulvae]|uniref:DUF4377 domain-containing protein n=1 Tax=Reichenbachiella ulvae TaxID=2980104 RepID=A0ABT3CUD4_9BACT|nr:DUF4377 domain-containing protein [Reichenbachiella ulvae]MCV9387169.1 DUF4377 domain-containing protein [Reichenbachiella ulvae]
MKRLQLLWIALPLIFASCEEENFLREEQVRIDHYQTVASGEGLQLVYRVQIDEQIGSDNWSYRYDPIEGLDYEWGYVYDVKVEVIKVNDPPADGSSRRYKLKELISKTPVESNVSFEIGLKNVDYSSESFVQLHIEEGYQLLSEVPIACDAEVCNELYPTLESESYVQGKFHHVGDGSIYLDQIIVSAMK